MSRLVSTVGVSPARGRLGLGGGRVLETQNRRSAGWLPAVVSCAPVGIRTPNLLIRRLGTVVQRGRFTRFHACRVPVRQLPSVPWCSAVAVSVAVKAMRQRLIHRCAVPPPPSGSLGESWLLSRRDQLVRTRSGEAAERLPTPTSQLGR